MKKLIAFSLIFVLLLSALASCGQKADKNFSDTAKDAYLKRPYQTMVAGSSVSYNTVNAEIDLIRADDTFGVWLAVVNEQYLVLYGMKIQNNTYCASGNVALYDLETLQQEPNDLEATLRIYDSFPFGENKVARVRAVPAAWISAEVKAADTKNGVTSLDYDVTYLEKHIKLTVSYYIENATS